MTRDCTCDRCVACCEVRPGKFDPGEAAKAAALLGLPLEEFFHRYLVVGYWMPDESHDKSTCWLMPARVNQGTGRRVGWVEGCGRCVFLTEDHRCAIHAAKPRECREALVCEGLPGGDSYDRNLATALRWEGHQDEIEALLAEGDEP